MSINRISQRYIFFSFNRAEWMIGRYSNLFGNWHRIRAQHVLYTCSCTVTGLRFVRIAYCWLTEWILLAERVFNITYYRNRETQRHGLWRWKVYAVLSPHALSHTHTHLHSPMNGSKRDGHDFTIQFIYKHWTVNSEHSLLPSALVCCLFLIHNRLVTILFQRMLWWRVGRLANNYVLVNMGIATGN